jgi:ferredoxin
MEMYFPLPQLIHSILFAVEYCPAEQFKQSAAASCPTFALNFPVAQSVQSDA